MSSKATEDQKEVDGEERQRAGRFIKDYLHWSKLEETGANVSDAIAEGAQLQSLKDNLGHLPSPVIAVSLVLKIGQHDLMIQHKKMNRKLLVELSVRN